MATKQRRSRRTCSRSRPIPRRAKAIEAQGLQAAPLGSREFGEFFRDEVKRYADLVKRFDIPAERHGNDAYAVIAAFDSFDTRSRSTKGRIPPCR